jgi:hypothetical protein
MITMFVGAAVIVNKRNRSTGYVTLESSEVSPTKCFQSNPHPSSCILDVNLFLFTLAHMYHACLLQLQTVGDAKESMAIESTPLMTV